MKEINKPTDNLEKEETKKQAQDKLAEIKKKQKKAEIDRFKSKYFEYYDDIKISDRQDW